MLVFSGGKAFELVGKLCSAIHLWHMLLLNFHSRCSFNFIQFEVTFVLQLGAGDASLPVMLIRVLSTVHMVTQMK